MSEDSYQRTKRIIEENWLDVSPEQYGEFLPGVIEALLEEIRDLKRDLNLKTTK